jgi:hypothetical protein
MEPMSATQQPDDFRLEEWIIKVPWIMAKPTDEKPHPSQTSNVVSLEQYRRARGKQQNNRAR